MEKLYVIKRSGKKELVSFDKILERITELSTDLSNVDCGRVAFKVIEGMHEGITTQELDELTAFIASSMNSIHPEYSTLGSRICINNLHKKTPNNFYECSKSLYENKNDKNINSRNLISKSLIDIIEKYQNEIQNEIDYSRDYYFDYFGFKTLENMYLFKVNGKTVERPQHLFMRTALAIHQENLEKVFNTYNLLSKKYFIHATPTLFNAGTDNQQLLSCFLIGTEDSVQGMYKTVSDLASIAAGSGGIGLHISNVRSKNSIIKSTNGRSNGIVPLLRVLNELTQHITQRSRPASIAIYLEPHHPEILEFLELRKNTGKEQERTRELFIALWINDLFMNRVKKDLPWSLFSEDTAPGLSEVWGKDYEKLYKQYEMENRAVKVIKAKDLWKSILVSLIETGTPYISYKDTINKRNNQQNLGTIKSSNLCVSADTKILTKEGYFDIIDRVGKETTIWNGEEWSVVIPQKTGENQEMVKVKLNDGAELICTKYHKFYNKQKKEIKASELTKGTKLLLYEYPIIEDNKDMKYAYTHGFCCGNKTKKLNGNIYLSDSQRILLDLIDKTEFKDLKSYITCKIPVDMDKLYFVPINYSLNTKLKWLSGLIDSDICNIIKTHNYHSIQIESEHLSFLKDIKYLLSTIGCFSKIKEGKKNKIVINSYNLGLLIKIGLKVNIYDLTGHCNENNQPEYLLIESVENVDGLHDTYCFTEPKNNKGIFNGILTGNCNEINEYSDSKEYACCTLASISLPAFVSKELTFDHYNLRNVVHTIVENLDIIVDINKYPVIETELSNKRHRPLGIGIQGLADVFMLMNLPFDSDESRKLNKEILETIYYSALEKSHQLAIEKGKYSTFDGSPLSKGLFQFDLANNSNEVLSGRWNFDELRKKIVKDGVRNSLLIALMPTASTSNILGNTECFEPITNNLYIRKTNAGEYTIFNKYLINDLMKLGIWNENMRKKLIEERGSVINIPEIPVNIKEIYMTAWEISKKTIIDMARDRGYFVCQSQSMNLYFDKPDFSKINSALFYGWEQGLKTGIYYGRFKAAVEAQQFTIEPKVDQHKKVEKVEKKEETCVMCSS